MKKWYFLIGLLLLSLCSFAGGQFRFSANIEDAYNKTLDLRFDEAKLILEKEKKVNPNNLMIHYVENYIDFLTIVITQDYVTYKALESKRNARYRAVRDGNRLSPYCLYVEAEMKLQWGMIKGLFGQYYGGIKDVKRAYKLLDANNKQFPQFMASKKSLGVIKIVFGNIPSSYQWITNIFGLKGSMEEGEKDLKAVMKYAKNNRFHFEKEVYLTYSYLLIHLGNSEELAWKYIQNPILDHNKSRLVLYVKSLIALRTGHTDFLISILENKNTDKRFYPIPQFEYFLGKAKLYKLDSKAKQHFLKYLQKPQGQHFIKASYHLLAWNALINGNTLDYKRYENLCRVKGKKVIYDDQKALEDANEPTVPQQDLLKARLLFDGGYYKKAESLLAKKKVEDFTNKAYRLEYIYRKGRTAEKLKQYNTAIELYKKTLTYDTEKKSYLTSKAILSIGMIYENQKNNTLAAKYYKMCLSFNPKRYKFSLHQQAKAGLNRIKK